MGNVKMRVWDVKHGSAIYVRTPNDKQIVIDLGKGDYSEGVEDRSPLETIKNHYKRSTINLLVITHPHKDHILDINNLDTLGLTVETLYRPKTFDVNTILENSTAVDKPIFEKYISLHNSYTGVASASQTLSNIDNYGGVSVKFFCNGESSDGNLNNHSVITVLTYENIKIVIPGDNEYKSLEALMQKHSFKEAVKDCNILIAPHHGRESAYHDDFVKHCNPQLTIISDSAKCDTSANSKYSTNSRGLDIMDVGEVKTRKLITTDHDGEVYIDFGKDPSDGRRYLYVEVK